MEVLYSNARSHGLWYKENMPFIMDCVGQKIIFRDFENKKTVFSIEAKHPYPLCASPDGKHYAFASGNSITVVNTQTQEYVPYKLSSKHFLDSRIMADFVTNDKIVCVYSVTQAFVPNSAICVIDLKEGNLKIIKALKNVLISDFCNTGKEICLLGLYRESDAFFNVDQSLFVAHFDGVLTDKIRRIQIPSKRNEWLTLEEICSYNPYTNEYLAINTKRNSIVLLDSNFKYVKRCDIENDEVWQTMAYYAGWYDNGNGIYALTSDGIVTLDKDTLKPINSGGGIMMSSAHGLFYDRHISCYGVSGCSIIKL